MVATRSFRARPGGRQVAVGGDAAWQRERRDLGDQRRIDDRQVRATRSKRSRSIPRPWSSAQGLGTITKKFKDQGKSPTITDLLSVNDQVVVSFKDEAGTKLAHEIRVTQKVAK